MKKNKMFYLAFGIIFVSGLSLYFFPSEKRDKEIEDVIEQTSFHPVIQEQLRSSDINLKDYEVKVGTISNDKKFHHEQGEKLYNIALGRLFYSKEKIKVLRMAKVHLLKAKNMEIK